MTIEQAINKVEPVFTLEEELNEIVWRRTREVVTKEFRSNNESLEYIALTGRISAVVIKLREVASETRELLRQID